MLQEAFITFEHCGGCGALGSDDVPLRRGRCSHCYDRWINSRAVGVGAACAACDDRRRAHLRHYEFGVGVDHGRWIVLCQNCAAFAASMSPPPASLENLKMRRARDRRWTDRRGSAQAVTSVERRHADDRRHSTRDLFDATDLLDELVLELEADYEEVKEDQITQDEKETTGIYATVAMPPDARSATDAILHSLDRA